MQNPNFLLYILIILASYLFGSVPFGLLIGKFAGRDIRLEGSKNIGATNVSRVVGKKFGVATLICDVLKGFLPILMVSLLLPDNEQKILWLCAAGLAAVVGHMYSVYLGFKGGKGVATGLGVFLFISAPASLISLVIFAAAVALTGFVSAGSLLASALIPVWLILFGKELPVIITVFIVSSLIWFKHRENIVRLARGEEKSWKKPA